MTGKITRRATMTAALAAGLTGSGGADSAPNKATMKKSGIAGLSPVWGEDFLYQWSPPEALKRDLTPGPSHIRLSSQSTPRLTGDHRLPIERKAEA